MPATPTWAEVTVGNATPQHALVNADIADGQVFFFENERLFRNIQIIGERAYGVDNAADVDIYLRQADGTYVRARAIVPGAAYNWPVPDDGPCFTMRSFMMQVNADGDGVRLIFS